MTRWFDIIKQFRARFKNKHTKIVSELIEKKKEGDITYYILRNIVETESWVPNWKDAVKRTHKVTLEELKEHWIELTNYEW
tara:strand:+ start:941 stop:1183 length:243 start_codon:yes stop_codon:yes gene_type:complete